MLELDQEKRITAAKTLEHEYLEIFHDEFDEPNSKEFDYQFEFEDLSLKEWKGFDRNGKFYVDIINRLPFHEYTK
jgi:hypothetical protein